MPTSPLVESDTYADSRFEVVPANVTAIDPGATSTHVTPCEDTLFVHCNKNRCFVDASGIVSL